MAMPVQRRILKTELPGPRSLELQARGEAHVTSGFGVTLPVFVDHARGGIIVDNVVRLLPPLVIDFDLLDDAVGVLVASITTVDGSNG